jgi:hypothetical protein
MKFNSQSGGGDGSEIIFFISLMNDKKMAGELKKSKFQT